LREKAMMDVATAAFAGQEIDKAVGIIAKMVGKLKAHPDLAAQKLDQALDEVAKTLTVVDGAVSEFLSLAIDEGALNNTLGRSSKLLLDIESGSLQTAVERGRGHCHIIGNIYQAHLDKWFAKVLSNDEYHAIRDVFMRLSEADDDLFAKFETVAAELTFEAQQVLDFVVNRDHAGARNRVLENLSALRSVRKTIAQSMQALYALKVEFIDIAGAGVVKA